MKIKEPFSMTKERLSVKTKERVFRPGTTIPVILDQRSDEMHLLMRVRDEAHRFAITYHRARRKKGTLRTSLTDVQGIGPKRASTLLNKLGSIARIRF